MKKKSKSMLAPLLALLLVLTLSACGGEAEEKPAAQDTTESAAKPDTDAAKESAAEPDSAAAKDSAAEPGTETAKEPVKETAAEGTLLETEYWSLTYSDEWSFTEDDLIEQEGSFSSVYLYIGDRSSYELNAFISATAGDPAKYRDNLQNNGKNLYDLVEKKSETPVNIGGVDCYIIDSESWGEESRCYYGRDEASSISVEVKTYGKRDDPRWEELLSTLQFKLEDIGNVDPPWPWNGEPFVKEGSVDKMVGTINLSASQVVLDESLVASDLFSCRIAASGQDVYALCDSTLKKYAYDGQKLSFVQDIPLDDEYAELSIAPDGTLYLSDFGSPLIGIKDGAKVSSYDGVDCAALAPDATWGISYFTSPDIKKFTLSGGAISQTAYSLAELKTINSVSITANHVFISGDTVANDETGIAVYDHEMNFQMMLGDKAYGESDSIGAISWVGETANGIMALDGNQRALCFWTADGGFIGSAKVEELFGTGYPWMGGAAIIDDGSMLICITQRRDDDSADEYLVFRVTGF